MNATVAQGAFKASPLGSPKLMDLLARAGDLQYAGRPAEALALYEQARRLAPGDPFVLNQTALALARLGRLDQALALFSRVVAAHPENAFARVWRGALLLERGEADGARSEFEAVLQREPAHGGAWYCLGVMALVERRPAEAADCFQRAGQGSAVDPDLLVRLARAFLALDLPANAECALRRALELSPRDARALNLLGWIEYNRGEVDAALAEWRRVLEIQPRDGDARRNMAKVLHEQAMAENRAGRRDKAEALWREALQALPGHKASLHSLQSGRSNDTIRP